MRIRSGITLASLLLVPVFFGAAVLAEEAQNSEQTSQTTQTKKDDTQTTDTSNKNTDDQKAKLKERLEKRKADAKLRLTTAQEKRLQTKCKTAQGFVKKIDGRNGTIETNRHKVHTTLVDRLNELQAKLVAKGVNTDTLKGQITELQTKVDTFNTDFAAYKQAVSDVTSIEDCTTDPTAFKTSLDAARTALQKVRDDAAAIRSYVKDTIKPTLAAIRAELNAPKNTEGTN